MPGLALGTDAPAWEAAGPTLVISTGIGWQFR